MAWRHLPLQWLATVTAAAVSTIVFFWIARRIGPAELGAYSLALSAAAFATLALSGGFRQLIFREQIGQRVDRHQISRLAVGHVAVLGSLAAVAIGVMADASLLWYGILVLAIGNTVALLIGAGLKAGGQFDKDATWLLLYRTTPAICAALVVVAWPGHAAAVWAAALALALTLALQWRWFARNPPSFRPRLALYRSIAALLLVDLATLIYFRIDVVLLAMLEVPFDQIGVYATATKVLEAFVLFTQPLSLIFFRELRLRWLSGADVRRRLAAFAGALMLVGGVLGLVVSLLGAPLLVLVLGEPYRDLAALLPWLMVALLFISANAILTQAAIALNQEWRYAAIAAAAALLNVVLNLSLVPFQGVLGAAWATIATEALLCLGLAWHLLRRRVWPVG